MLNTGSTGDNLRTPGNSKMVCFLAQDIRLDSMETSEREKKNEKLTTEKEVAFLLPHVRFSADRFPF